MDTKTYDEMRGDVWLCLYQANLNKIFEEFSKTINAGELIQFIREIDNYRVLNEVPARMEKLAQIEKEYLKENSPYAVHVDSNLKKEWEAKKSTAPLNAFDAIQASVFSLLQASVYPGFTKSPQYKQFQDEFSLMPEKQQQYHQLLAYVPRVVDLTIICGKDLNNKGKSIDNVVVKVKFCGSLVVLESVREYNEVLRYDWGRKKTKSIKTNAKDPVWNETFSFNVEQQGVLPYLLIEVATKDSFFGETPVGHVLVGVAETKPKGEGVWIPFRKKSGEIQILLQKRM